MSYYTKDLVESCACGSFQDTSWFLFHPDRKCYLRVPTECEEARIEDDQVGIVSQLVCVSIDKSINQLALENNHDRGVMEVRTRRRSFLFMGRYDFCKVDSDEAVVQFLEFIDDGDGQMVNVTVN
jgi:hypothetical protein